MNALMRRRLLRIFLIVLLLPTLLAGLAYAYAWYQVRSVIEDVAAQLAPIATLSYQQIELNPEPVAGVRGLELMPLGQQTGIKIDAVRLRASDWLALIGLRRAIDSGDLPQRLGLEIEGLRVAADSPLIEQYQQLAVQAGSASAAPSDWMPGCGLTEAQPGSLLKQLGYSQLVFDWRADYHFDQGQRLLNLWFHQAMRDSFESDLSMKVDLKINQFDRHNLQFVQPWVQDIELSYQDQSLNRRINKLCAKRTDSDIESFVAVHIERLIEQYRQIGFEPGEALVEGYRDFMLGEGRMELSLLQGQPLGAPMLSGITPERLQELLSPELRVNGKLIEPLELRLVEEQEGEAPAIQEKVQTQVDALAQLLQTPFVEEVDIPEPVPNPAVDSPLQNYASAADASGYISVGINQLSGFVGSDIRIETRNGFLLAGRLLSVGKQEIRIYREVGTGDATLPIAFKHIESVKVYR